MPWYSAPAARRGLCAGQFSMPAQARSESPAARGCARMAWPKRWVRGVAAVDWPARDAGRAGAALLARTTIPGMTGQPPTEIDRAALPTQGDVRDAVQVPLETALLAVARARGNQVAHPLACYCTTRIPDPRPGSVSAQRSMKRFAGSSSKTRRREWLR